MNNYRERLIPIGWLAGTIIGAGMFSLPFVFDAAGLPLGFVALAFGTMVFVATHLLYADIILITPGEHRFVGFASRYLGRFASSLALLMSVPQMLLVLTIYLVLAPRFGELITPGFGSLTLYGFWLLGSALIFFELRTLATLEFFMTGAIAAIVVFLFLFSVPYLSTMPPRLLSPHWSLFFLPFAPILFALSGRVAIPSLIRYVRRVSGASIVASLRSTIALGTILPAICYGLFVLGVLALAPRVSDDAVTGLLGTVPLPLLFALGFLGLASLLSSYIVVGLDVSNILEYDLHVPRFLRQSIVVGIPIALYVLGLQQFIALVSFTGGVFLSLEGIFIALMWLRLPASERREGLLGCWGMTAAVGTFVVFCVVFFATLFL